MEVIASYNPLLHSFGLPYRLEHGRSFTFTSAVKTFELGEDKVVPAKKQEGFFKTACKSDTGWTMFICSDNYLDKPKHIAANIMQSYFERDMKSRWLTSFNKLDKTKFFELKLVIIDAIFFDSSNYHRDKIYEVINHYCNVKDMSLIILGRHSDPAEMGRQLGMRFDMAIMCK